MRPTSEAELLDAIRSARSARTGLLVAGGRTLLPRTGTATEVLDTTALEGVRSHVPADLVVTCGAGTTLTTLNAELSGQGQTVPVLHPDPDRATIGGLVAHGWAGIGSRLFGPLRDRVLEVRVVTGEGEQVRGGGKVVKNVTGFDLPRLFFGSHGTLGVVHEVTLKVHPRPRPLFAVQRSGDNPAELARWLSEGSRTARLPVEAVLSGGPGGWTATAWAPGPRPDAETLLAAFEGQVIDGDELMASVAAYRLPLEASMRIGVPSARTPDLAARLPGPALVDVGTGRAWAVVEPDGIEPLDAWTSSVGGHLDTVDTRHRPSEGPGAGIMRSLKRQFDPDGILCPGLEPF
jgi:glycolate oxidase FAD binding subunit